jgi:hypothetical protein
MTPQGHRRSIRAQVMLKLDGISRSPDRETNVSTIDQARSLVQGRFSFPHLLKTRASAASHGPGAARGRPPPAFAPVPPPWRCGLVPSSRYRRWHSTSPHAEPPMTCDFRCRATPLCPPHHFRVVEAFWATMTWDTSVVGRIRQTYSVSCAGPPALRQEGNPRGTGSGEQA